MVSRRTFLQHAIAAGAVLLIGPGCARGQGKSRSVLVNHLGFPKLAGKNCMLSGRTAVQFDVHDVKLGKTAFEGAMSPVKGDHGDYLVGDFSAVAEPGEYEITVGGQRSARFAIGDDVYTPMVRDCIEYFAKQRCGDSRSGYNAPCHLDDGRMFDRDSGRAGHRDVSGGWHDACDLRKWTDCTLYGMVGLSRALELLGPHKLDRARVIDELRWGNSYFQKMQQQDGSLMSYCGGDDGNHFTDNKIGSPDDRRIHTEPVELPGQFTFIAAQAALARLVKNDDPQYARGCMASAQRCLDWCTTHRTPGAATSLGAAVIACVELHRAAQERRYANLAVQFLERLLKLQVAEGAGQPTGYFLRSPDTREPSREVMHGNLPLIALGEAVLGFADHPDVGAWREALTLHVRHLREMTARSAFGTVPFGMYFTRDPGGGRRIGNHWYRWFMKPQGEKAAGGSGGGDADDWWVGINAHLASHGVGLCIAARALSEPALAAMGQRQLDWVLGVNPFDASTVSEWGRKQPRLFETGEFSPTTPLITGGVMNGIGGTRDDEATLDPASYNTCEYWTPMVAYAMWLAAELSAD
jgi:hypothetical protein